MKNKIFYLIFSMSCLLAHCQVPCGIYDDARKVIEIEENILTINKAMESIQLITIQLDRTGQDTNQLVRWINTKEEHAQNIQDIIMEYFLAQRIKPKEPNDDDYLEYVNLTTLCQHIIYYAMKTKQTVDIQHTEKLVNLINKLINNYFDIHGVKHLNDLRNN